MRHDRSDSDEDESGDERAIDTRLGDVVEGGSVSSRAEDDAEGDGALSLRASDDRDDSKRPVAWSELPRKDQLFIITMARMSEPLVQTSLQVRLELVVKLVAT
jgi:hypothetical protein